MDYVMTAFLTVIIVMALVGVIGVVDAGVLVVGGALFLQPLGAFEAAY